jgi:PKD repeat protein
VRIGQGGFALRVVLVTAFAVLGLSVMAAGRAVADAGVIAGSYKDFVYDDDGAGGFSITGSKPESKLWFNDGIWWADMAADAGGHHIYRLDRASEQWIDTGTALDPRFASVSDIKWDAASGTLYVASHSSASTSSSSASGTDGQLYRFHYNSSSKSYTRDAGYPVSVGSPKTESLVIDKDSTGTLWATWQAGGKIYVNHTQGGSDANWGTPYVLPGSVDVNDDDLSSLLAFDGRIAVVWSNQTPGTKHSGPEFLRMGLHADGSGDTSLNWATSVIPTGWSPDDHINLKADSDGNLFVATKTSEDVGGNPLTLLLRRATDGGWTEAVFGTVANSNTRPIVLLDEGAGVAHMLATCPSAGQSSGQSGGDICEKTTPMTALAFPAGVGTRVITDPSSHDLNDVTSTKQGVDGGTGIVVLASDKDTNLYWHSDRSLGSSPVPHAPVATFSATPASGTAPLTVQFTDGSANAPTSWSWDFGDGGTSSARNPSHVFSSSGSFTVKLTAANSAGAGATTSVIQVAPGTRPDELVPRGPAPLAGAEAPTATRIDIAARDTTVPYGRPATVLVRLSGGTIAGVPVQLQTTTFPFHARFADLLAPAFTDAAGAQSFVLRSLRVTTRAVVIAAGRVSAVVTLRSAARPLLTSLRRSGARGALVRGRVEPATPDGVADVQRRTPRGRWVRAGRADVDPRTGRFSLRVTAAPGAVLRVVARPRDGGAHVAGAGASVRVPRA